MIACGRAGTGPDVVSCDGTPFSSTARSRYADALSSDFTVHLWDMPGYGQSSKDPDDTVDHRCVEDTLDPHDGQRNPIRYRRDAPSHRRGVTGVVTAHTLIRQ